MIKGHVALVRLVNDADMEPAVPLRVNDPIIMVPNEVFPQVILEIKKLCVVCADGAFVILASGISLNREYELRAVRAHHGFARFVLIARRTGVNEFQRDAAHAGLSVEQRADARLVGVHSRLQVMDIDPHGNRQRVLLSHIGQSQISVRRCKFQRLTQTETAGDKLCAGCVGQRGVSS